MINPSRWKYLSPVINTKNNGTLFAQRLILTSFLIKRIKMENNFGVTGFVFNDNYEWENFDKGIRRKILGYDKDIMLVHLEFKKGAIGYLHKHPHKQIGYIVSGSFEVTVDGEKKNLKAGDVYLTLPNIEHGVLALEDSIIIDVFTPYREDFINK